MKPLNKYFEITLNEASDWTIKEYILFVIETLYSTVFPFIAGMLLVRKGELIWLLMLVLPIYFKLRISKKKFVKKHKIFIS
jgi:hypothetical protein